MTTSHLRILLALAALTSVGASDCGGNVLGDPGFDTWSGDVLTSWILERGEIARVPTWHDADDGVSFLGEDTAISQVATFTETCIELSFLANVAEGVDMQLAIDVESDGVLDHFERIPTSNWAPVSFRLAFAPPYSSVKFILEKRGLGQAVIAEVRGRALEALECQGAPIPFVPRAIGGTCGTGADCQSNVCNVVCSECVTDAECGSGEVCGFGVALPVLPVAPHVCVPRETRLLGERCYTGDECTTGICQQGYCSACAGDGYCAGTACAQSWAEPDGGATGPSVCRSAGPGAPCGADGDCASGRCNGTTRLECANGTACSPGDRCPGFFGDDSCSTTGIIGGSCT